MHKRRTLAHLGERRQRGDRHGHDGALRVRPVQRVCPRIPACVRHRAQVSVPRVGNPAALLLAHQGGGHDAHLMPVHLLDFVLLARREATCGGRDV
eukprot:4956266-Pyramimonas_sp.AAC.1